jgi:regulator of cell morphogenesis and NO signaling
MMPSYLDIFIQNYSESQNQGEFMNALANRTVGEMVAERPTRARVFERLGIDYCCGGKQPLETACRQKGLDAALVAEELAAFEQSDQSPAEPGWINSRLTDLIDHILTTHHVYLKRELPRLYEIVDKVVAAHGANHPELADVRHTFAMLKAELDEHMIKEENILFPTIVAMETGRQGPLHCGGIDRPIAVMEHEHDSAGRALATLRQLTHDYRAPDDACNTYRVMLSSLAELEADLHQHISKENNILFPRSMQLAGLR